MAASSPSATPLERVVAALQAAGCNPRGTNQITARCPVVEAHKGGDRNPSLSVCESPVGKALVYCHAGCTASDVTSALGLTWTDLFPREAPKMAQIDSRGQWKATYSYHDNDGTVIYQVVRFQQSDGRKTFRQRRPDGNGGWHWNLTGVERVLYHLPQVRRAVETGRTIVVTEGEKDAENAEVARPNCVATTNSGGAGAWNETYAAALEGAKRVVVFVDDDKAGYKHGIDVLESLAGRVGALQAFLPEQGYKDLSDQLRAVGTLRNAREVTLDELQSLAGMSVDEDDEQPVEDLSFAHLIDWAEFWSGEQADEDWLAWPLIPAGRAVALYAPAKAGKSSVVLAIVAQLATGRKILDRWPCEPVHVLYLDFEMTESDLQERLVELGYGPDVDMSHLHYALLPSMPPLDTPEGAKAITALAEAVDAQAVIVDTFGRAVEGDENEADTVRAFYRHTGLALKQAKRAVLRTDHAGKDTTKGQRGSSAKADDVDVVWSLRRTDDGVALKRTHSRIAWVPEEIDLQRLDDDRGGVRWKLVDHSYPAGTKEAAEAMDDLNLPLDVSVRRAAAAIREAGGTVKNSIATAAVRWRQQAAEAYFQPVDKGGERAGERFFDPSGERSGGTLGTKDESPAHPTGNAAGNAGEQASPCRGNSVPPYKGHTFPTDGSEAPVDDDNEELF